jgi:hypothetical protein
MKMIRGIDRIGRTFSTIIILLCVPDIWNRSSAQTVSSHDGVSIYSASTNTSTFYYGEPVVVYFQFINTTAQVKSYYKPQADVNLVYELKNKTTGNVLSLRNQISAAGQMRGAMKTKPPKNPYKPNEYGYYSIALNEQFGTVLLSNSQIAGSNELVDKLVALPVGKYEMSLQYHLFPGDKSLKLRYEFEILPLDVAMEQELEQYVRSTVYSAKSHFYTGKNYSSRHADSFENFLSKNPKSIYANHAFLNMIIGIYHYAAAGPSNAERFQKFAEYVQYYSQLRNNTIKMDYVNYLPTAIKNQPNKNVKAELDAFLQKIKGENPEISKMLIRSALFEYDIQGLTNYAIDNR